MTFAVTLSAEAEAEVTATWTASIETGDSAESGDFTAVAATALTFTAGQTAKTLTVATTEDTTDEEDETFTVTLSNPSSNAALATGATAKGTIEDDDDPPTLTVADLRHDENDVLAYVTVSLSELSEKRARFKLQGLDRTGDTASDADWDQRAGSSFYGISAGTMSGSFVAVLTVNDTLDEDDETLTVEAFSLENAQGSASDREATITIVDDDPTPTVTVADAAASEGGKVAFTVTLSAVSGRDVEVDYATSVVTGQTATSDTDFMAASGTLTILAAASTATGTVEVQTAEDDDEEEDETFTLTISDPENATLGTDTAATGTIENRNLPA